MADEDRATFAERFTGESSAPQPTPAPTLVPGTEGNTFANPQVAKQYAAEQFKKGNYIRGTLAGLESMVASAPSAILGLFGSAHESYEHGQSVSKEIEFGVNAALTQIGGGEAFKLPKGSASAFEQFHEQVTKPLAQNLSVPDVEPPQRITIPLDTRNVDAGNWPPPGARRSELAQTGEPHVDAVINHPTLKNVINNPIIDRTHEIPNSWGGSVPVDNPVTYIDKEFPRALQVDGVVFDPADAAVIHENAEELVVTQLEKGGMSRDAALRAAYWGWGNPAEHAWYRAHGMDPDHVEAALKPYLDKIAARKPDPANIPNDLFKETYPNGDPLEDVAGAIDKPSPEEAARAKQIIEDWRARPAFVEAYTGLPEGVKEPSTKSGAARTGIPTDQGTVYFTPRQSLAENYAYGGNIQKRAIDTSNAGVYDVNRLVDDPKFIEEMRAAHYKTSTRTDFLKAQAETPEGAARIKENFESNLARIQARRDNDFRLPRYHDMITGAIIERARAAGQDVAIVKNMAEGHGQAADQLIVLDDRAIRPEGTTSPSVPPIVNPLQEARELGVIGPLAPENINLAELARREAETPAEAAFRAVPLGAAVTPEGMRGVLGHAPGEYNARGKEWIDKIDMTDNAKGSIEALAKQYDFFPEARGGTPSAASRAAVAEAAGIDPRDMDSSHFTATFDSDGKVRAVVQALRQTTQDFVAASDKLRREPNEINAAAALEAQERQKYVLEYTLGARAESGRSLAAWKDLLRETEHARAAPKIKAEEAAGTAPQGLSDLVNAARDVVNNLKPKAKGPAGLDKLVKAARDLVEGQDKLPETRQKLGGLAKRARDLAKEAAGKEAEPGKTPSGLAGLINEAEELAKTLPSPPKEVGKPKPQGIPQMIAEARRAINGPSGAQALIKLAEEAERLADTMPRTPAEAATKLPPDIAGLVNQARSLVSNLAKPGTTDLEKLVGQVDKQTRDILKSKPETPPKEALPPEWQALVDKADLVTKRFGGIAKGEQAAMLLARSGRTAAEQAELARQVEGLTPNQVARVLERLRTEKRPGWIFWAVQQALISGLITHTKYAVVNTASTVFDRIIAPETAAIIGKVRGQDTSLLAPLRSIPEFFNAVPDALAGAKQAFKTGTRVPLESELRLAARGEESPEAAGAQVPYGTPQGPDWGRVGRWFPEGTKRAESIMGAPGRSANSIHTVFKIINERMAAGTRAFEKAEAEGNKPGTQQFWNRYHYHLDNPTDDVLRANVEDGYSGTFMEKLGKQSEAFARLVKNTPAKWLIFFTHIPLNMARKSVEYSPLAFLNTLGETKMGSAIKGELGADAQNLAFAKIAIGTAIGGYFISRALSGQMTGDYPTNAKERRRWANEGIQPNSIQADGQWISLERLGPQATVARIAANFADVIKNYDGSDNDAFMKATWATVLGTARALASDVGFETIRNIVDIMEDPQKAAKQTAYQLASYTMPISFVAQFASFHDPYMRVANDYISALKSRLPLLRETLPEKRDPLYGEPVANPGYHAIFRSAPIQQDPIKMELDRIGYFPAYPQKTIGGVKLSEAQYDKYQATAGPLVKRALTDLMDSPEWQTYSQQEKQAAAKQYIAAARKDARASMQLDDGGKLILDGNAQREQQITGK